MYGIDTSISHFFSRIRGTRIVGSPDIVSEVLHIPRVAHPNYPSCARLRTVSKDKLSFFFYEIPSSWGDRQNTLCLGFAKGPRFLNIVMTFILHPLSHYNSITEPHARFLLSLLEDISIDFPSLHNDRLSWVVSLLLLLHLHWLLRMRVMMTLAVLVLMMRCLLDVLTLCHS